MRFATLLLASVALFAADDDWPRWRGPNDDGMARGAAPLQWSDTTNVAWRVTIPGRGHSSPVIWGDKIFITTAVPADGGSVTATAPPPGPPLGPPAEGPPPVGKPGRKGGFGGGGGAGGGMGAGREHKFVIMCLNRHTGKVLWERVAATAAPHEGYHGRYGSFASNSPVTDGKRLYASFGSRGVFCYDLDGKLIWQKEFPPMRMRLDRKSVV